MDFTSQDLLSMMVDSMEEEEDESISNERNESISKETNNPARPADTFTCPGFDTKAGEIWIYPTNYPVRDYQYAIVQKALFQNTLVCLPTGLGKTFIAAVVMYNFYRWYPKGKIIFMAPTKPLVNQQIDACYKVMGIPESDSTFMTGNDLLPERQERWKSKRVFFLTPQVMVNDLGRGALSHDDIRCVVVDEAHKATGERQAYVLVVKELLKRNRNFRILALSATPGKDLQTVQQLLFNLAIANIELRTEESSDIKPYTFNRLIEEKVVPLGKEIEVIRDKYYRIVGRVFNRLKMARVLYGNFANIENLTKYGLIQSREQFRKNPPAELENNNSKRGQIEADYYLLMTLVHATNLLLQHSAKTFYKNLISVREQHHVQTEYKRSEEFQSLMDLLEKQFGDHEKQGNEAAEMGLFTQMTGQQTLSAKTNENGQLITGHPKLDALRDVVVEHLERFRGKTGPEAQTRIMIFAEFRESVGEIAQLLNHYKPLVKVMSFVGQSSKTSTSSAFSSAVAKGLSQKDQLEVLRMFREGDFNTLVATCVGEEGLDIGDVDLIICYDSPKSATRMVQRMGRTGRKRDGRIVVLLTKGKEEWQYRQAQTTKQGMDSTLEFQSNVLQFYQKNPRMVPSGIEPSVHKMHITVAPAANKTKGKRKQKGSHHKITDWVQREDTNGEANEISTRQNWILSVSEKEELREKFELSSSEKFINFEIPSATLQGLHHAEEFESTLNEFAFWQSSRQGTKNVGTSLRGENLVESMQLIERIVDESDDLFGNEMKLYLNEEDKKTSSLQTIKQFFATNSVNDSDKTISIVKSRKKSRVEVEVVAENSDDELPALEDFFSKRTSKAEGNALQSVEHQTSTSSSVRNILKQFAFDEDEQTCDPQPPVSYPTVPDVSETDSEDGHFPSVPTDAFPEMLMISADGTCGQAPYKRDKKLVVFPTPPPLTSVEDDVAALEALGDNLNDSGIDLEEIWRQVEQDFQVALCSRKNGLKEKREQVDTSTIKSIAEEVYRSTVVHYEPDAEECQSVQPMLLETKKLLETQKAAGFSRKKLGKSSSFKHITGEDKTHSPVKICSSPDLVMNFNLLSSDSDGDQCEKVPDPEKAAAVEILIPFQVEETMNFDMFAEDILVPDGKELKEKMCDRHNSIVKDVPVGSQKQTRTASLTQEEMNFDLFDDEFDLDVSNLMSENLRNDSNIKGRSKSFTQLKSKPCETLKRKNNLLTISQAMDVLQEPTQKLTDRGSVKKRSELSEPLKELQLTDANPAHDDLSNTSICHVGCHLERENISNDETKTISKPIPTQPFMKGNKLSRLRVSQDENLPETPAANQDSIETSLPTIAQSKSQINFGGSDFVDDDVDLEALAQALLLKEQEEALQRFSQAKEASLTQIEGKCLLQQSDSEEDSFVLPVPSKRKKTAVISSPDTPGTSAHETESRNAPPNTHDSVSDESPFVRRRPGNHRKIVNTDNVDETPTHAAPRRLFSKTTPGEEENQLPSRRKRFRRRREKGMAFLDTEAALSGSDESSDDEDESQMDSNLASLIHDGSPEMATQALRSPPPDERAMYLQSRHSPDSGLQGKFKLSYGLGDHIDVYSQPQQKDDEDEYEHDSFCVDSMLMQESCRMEGDDEVSPDKQVAWTDDRMTRRQKRIFKANLEWAKNLQAEDDAKSRKRRVVKIVESDSSDEEVTITTLQKPERSPPSSQGFTSPKSFSTPINAAKHKSCIRSDTNDVTEKTSRNGRQNIEPRQMNFSKSSTTLKGNQEGSVYTSSSCIASVSSSSLQILTNSKPSKEGHPTMSSESPCLISNLSRTTSMASSMPSTSSDFLLLVDSRQLASGSDVISNLNMYPNARTRVMQLHGTCDYVVSSRVAVVRVMSSDFSAAANKAQIIKRIQTMAHYYERSMLIIEVDRGAQDVTRTRHMDSLLCLIFQARHTRVFYSDNQTETAKILKDLATSEDRKGARLPSPAVKSNALGETVGDHKFEFLRSLQGMPPAAAINCMTKYPSLRSILISSAADLSLKGLMSIPRANKISAIFRKRVNALDVFD